MKITIPSILAVFTVLLFASGIAQAAEKTDKTSGTPAILAALDSKAVIHLDDNKSDLARGTFFAFGFVPTTGSMVGKLTVGSAAQTSVKYQIRDIVNLLNLNAPPPKMLTPQQMKSGKVRWF